MQNDSERTHRLRCLSTRATSEEDSRKKKKISGSCHIVASRRPDLDSAASCFVFCFLFFLFFFSNVASNVLHQMMKNAVRIASELSPQWD